jgi:hypothetical protein
MVDMKSPVSSNHVDVEKISYGAKLMTQLKAGNSTSEESSAASISHHFEGSNLTESKKYLICSASKGYINIHRIQTEAISETRSNVYCPPRKSFFVACLSFSNPLLYPQ